MNRAFSKGGVLWRLLMEASFASGDNTVSVDGAPDTACLAFPVGSFTFGLNRDGCEGITEDMPTHHCYTRSLSLC